MESECKDIPNAAEKFSQLREYIATLGLNDDPERNRGYLIQVLHKAQMIFGHLPEIVQKAIADKLRLYPAEVYGVISFYSFFTMKPRGKYTLSVCMGTACYVNGAQDVIETLKQELSIDMEETTDDGKFTLGVLRCVGACGLAPVLLVNDKAYGHVTPDKARQILKSYAEQSEA